MAYDYIEDTNIMNALFKGKIKIQKQSSKYERVEIGHGMGIGHDGGSRSQYLQQLAERSKEGNGLIYLGKGIQEGKDTMSIVGETNKFYVGDIPKVLLVFSNVINKMTLKLDWKNARNNSILEQYYEIPSPYSLQHSWWDTYSVHFAGSEDLDEGNYKIDISSTKKTRLRTEELSSTIEFSIEDKDE